MNFADNVVGTTPLKGRLSSFYFLHRISGTLSASSSKHNRARFDSVPTAGIRLNFSANQKIVDLLVEVKQIQKDMAFSQVVV